MGHFFSGGGFVMWCDSADMMPYSIHCIQYTMRHDCISFSLSSLLCRRFYLPNTFQLFLVCISCFFSLLFVCCQTRPVYYSIFHQKFYAHHFFFHSVHSHSPNANSSRGCFSTWLLTSISMEVMGVHKKERDSSEHEQDKATVMLLLVLLPLYIYTFNAQNRIYDDKPFVVGLTKDNGIQVKCANIIKIIQRTVRHHLTIT